MECAELPRTKSTTNDIITIRHKCGHIVIKWLGSFTLETIPWQYLQKKIEEHTRNCHLYDNTKVTQMTDFQHLDEKPTVWPVQKRIDEI
jgi:hypothetical protein